MPALAQDECGAAAPIGIGASVAYDTTGATPSAQFWWCNPVPHGDIWFRYDAATTGTVRAETCDTRCKIEVYRGPCANPTWVGCDDGRCVFAGTGTGTAVPFHAESGSTYFIRVVARVTGGASTVNGVLSLLPHVAPAHDECAGAIPVGLGTPVTIDAFEATLSANPAACAFGAAGDVWYSFTPAVNGTYVASTCDGQPGLNPVEVLTGACGALTSLGCNETVCVGFQGATQSFLGTAGTTYWIRTYHTSPWPQTGQLVVQQSATAANDECATAQPIAIGQVIPFDTLTASASVEPWACMAGGSADLWYRFTPPRSGRYVAAETDPSFDAVVEILDGTCGALTSQVCGRAQPAAALDRLEFTGTAGVDVWVRVAGWNGGVGTGALEIVEVPDNDECAGASAIGAGAPTPIDLALATPSPEPWGCDLSPAGGFPVRDAWFRFVAPAAGSYVVRTCGTSAAPFVEVLSGSCGSSATLDCRYDFDCTQTYARFTAAAGASVIVRFGIASNEPLLGLVEVASDAAPGNDECAGAAPIGLGATPFDLTFATHSTAPATGCSTAPLDDVFFTFVPAVGGRYRAQICGSTSFALEVFEGVCAPLGLRSCGIGACPAVGGWTPGATVYFDAVAGASYTIRLGHVDGPTGGAGVLELATQAPPSNDDCSTPLPVVAGSTPFDSSFATAQGSAFVCEGQAGADVWFRYVATTTGQTDFTLCGTYFPSVLEVRPDGSCGTGAVLACNRAAMVCQPPAFSSSAVGVQVTAGTAYLVRVGAFPDVPGPGVLNIYEGIDLGDAGTPYCGAQPNSTGQPAALRGVGSTSLIVDDFTLRSTQLPSGSFGYYLVSRQQGLVLGPGGSRGDLCLGGAIGRYVGPGQVGAAGASGAFELPVSLFWIPQPTGPVVSSRGETWNWQLWYRDQVGGQATSNFSNGLSGVIQ